jgi:Protein of unknown function (DUF1214)
MNTPVATPAGRMIDVDGWNQFIDTLMRTGQTLVFEDKRVDSPRLRSEGVRNIVRTFASAAAITLEQDARYPRLVRLFDPWRQHGNANPDCLYCYAELSPEYTYRIHGRRGTAPLFEVQIMDEHMLAHPHHKSLHSATELEADADGTIEVTLSATPQPRNWVPLAPQARWMYFRQYFQDWDNEIPADVVIERSGATYPPPPVSPEWLDQRIALMTRLFQSYCQSAMNFVGTYYAAPPGGFDFVLSKSGLTGLFYGKGHFECPPGHAVILEFEPPPCPYWSFQVMNHFWESLDWDMRQTSLNCHQAVMDPDGVFRAVICTDDPGVPNWLDPAGHANGLICARVLRPGSEPAATMRVAAIADIRRHLHPATGTLSPAERSELLRRRMHATARLHRP